MRLDVPPALHVPVPAPPAGQARLLPPFVRVEHPRRRPAVPLWAVLTVLASTVAFAVLTVLIAVPGPVREFDWWLWNQGFEVRYPGKRVMTALAVVGQRGPVLVLVGFVAIALSRRLGTWRPLVVLAGSQLLLNAVVGALKYGLGRAKAETGSADLFAGGTMYPSGHSSNAVVVWGVLAYLLIVYAGVRRRRLVVGLAVLPSVVVAVATLFIGSHWATDVLGGVLVGAALLVVTVALDRRWGRDAVLASRLPPAYSARPPTRRSQAVSPRR